MMKPISPINNTNKGIVTLHKEHGRRRGIQKTRVLNIKQGDRAQARKTFKNRQKLTERTGAYEHRTIREERDTPGIN